ncbi:16S rRNA (uracil(1498)-N(3))-methyltransferase [Arthrobacter frigidicola]|nr:16S rRNA (uracil(1498)-N(3))-methyltransferase [Arthrobacter frigidicola]
MTYPLFFGEPAAVRSARVGSVFVLGGDEGRHATTVRRLAPGEWVDVADGAGFRLRGTVTDGSAGTLAVRVESAEQEEAPREKLVLIQALAKGDRDEQAIEAATELGVDAVVPWQAERSIVRWRAEKAVKGQRKWEAVVAGAAKQSRRAWIPEVHPLLDSGRLPAWSARFDRVFVLSETAGEGLARLVAGPSRGGTTAVIVGPEGGISERELLALQEAGASAARLGPHVLRSSSAGPAALVLLNHLLGRW